MKKRQVDFVSQVKRPKQESDEESDLDYEEMDTVSYKPSVTHGLKYTEESSGEEEEVIKPVHSDNWKFERKYEENYDNEDFEDEIEPFNTENDRQLGTFDESGNFVFNKRNDEDAWYSSITKEDILKGKKAHQKPIQESEEQEVSILDLYSQLARLLNNAETPLDAIRRFAKTNKDEKKSVVRRSVKCPEIDLITELCDSLIRKGRMSNFF